jgi:maleate isomerase
MPPKPLRLGILVPSSNTALEPLTQSLIASLPGNSNPASPSVTVHFSRFAVTSISLSPDGIKQFTHSHIVAAAQLLAHAEVDIIGWSGTSAGWLGFQHDDDLCAAITSATGIPCTTSVRALNRALSLFQIKKLGLVTPYLSDVQSAIIANYTSAGIEISPATERHLGVAKNTEIGLIGEEVLDGLVREAVEGTGAEAVTTFCTNWVAAQRVEHWEGRLGVPVFDTVSVVVWDMLTMGGFDVKSVRGWASLFQKS